MSISVLNLTKITAPKASNVIKRERLFKVLDEAMKKQVIWVSSPAGAGKTTLITSYLESKKIKPMWYQVDAGDADLPAFFYYLGQGVNAATGSRKKMLVLTPEYQFGISAFTCNYFRELFSRFKKSSVLVFDNYQDAGSDALLNQMLPKGFQEIPAGITVIIISRTEPPEYFTRLRSTGQLTEIGWPQIQFTDDEEYDITKQRYPERKISKNLIKNFNTYTQGWVTGLILFLEQEIEPEEIISHFSDASQNHIFDYFATEVLHHADVIMREFLLKSSLLPKMTISIARELTGIGSTKKILTDLTHRQFFTVRHGMLKTSYEYHPLFRDFLLIRAQERFNENDFQQLQAKAGRLLSEAKDVDNAVGLLQQSMSWAVLSELIEKHVKELIGQGRNKQLEQWINLLPAEYLEERPWINFWLGECKLQFEPKEARPFFVKAYGLFFNKNDSEGAYLAWINIATSYFFAMDGFVSFSEWMDELSVLRKRWPRFPTMEIRVRMVYSVLTCLPFAAPNHEKIEEWIGRAETLFKYIPVNLLRVLLGQALVAAHIFVTADLVKFQNLVITYEPLTSNKSLPLIMQIIANLGMSGLAWAVPLSSKLDAFTYIDRALKISHDSGVKILDALTASQGVYASIVRGDLQNAERYLNKVKGVLNEKNRVDISHYYKLLGSLEIEKKNYPLAVKYLQNSLEIIHVCETPYLELTVHCALVVACMGAGNDEQAQLYYKQAEEITNEKNGEVGRLLFSSVTAWLYCVSNDEQKMLNALRRLFATASDKLFAVCVVHIHSAIPEICARALENNIEVSTVKEIVRQYNIVPDDLHNLTESWPFPIKLYTLGRFTVVKGGAPIQSGRKAQKKALELLKILIALGGRAVSSDKLAQVVWPDLDGDAAHNTFNTTLYRLRKLLGNEALTYNDGRLSLDPRYCWVDVWVVERNLNLLQELNTEHLLERGFGIIGKVFEHYKGHFLETDGDTAWSISLRERLHNKLLRQLDTLGIVLCDHQRYDQALTLYQQGLDIDNLAESLYQGIMQCCIHLDQRATGMTTYQCCRKTLHKVLNVCPSNKTEELRTALQS